VKAQDKTTRINARIPEVWIAAEFPSVKMNKIKK